MIRIPALLAAALAAAGLAGCTFQKPPGAGTVRYRDQVFTNVTKTSDIVYGRATPEHATTPIDLKLDLYQPTGDTQTQRPAIVWAHGGGFCCGDKGGGPAPDLAQKFAKLGYVTVSINYRLISTGCTGANVTPDCFAAAVDGQHDAQAAVRFLRAHAADYGIDPTRIGIGGESAGAIMATAVGLRPDDVGDSGNPGYPSSVAAFDSISGGLPQGVFASAGDAPGLLFHGTADGTVPFQWSADTTKKMLAAGVPAFLDPLVGAGHVPYADYGQRFYEQSDYFFYDLMDLAHAAGQPASVRRAGARMEATARRYPAFARVMRARKGQARQIRAQDARAARARRAG